ncbi:MAG: hypothetical protein QG629_790 [Patescibacteria group bacterium]|nr:LysM peptidoglycan-binding domain-containing protein [Candidatus Saccharibacteria bacterium]MDQ5963707.1 hypothetical protein [Patescibacteria group bacterium]
MLLGVVVFIYHTSHKPEVTTTAALNTAADADAAVVNPVDRLTSYDVAVNMATALKLDEKTAITSQAQSAKVAVEMSASDTASIAPKPQLVNTTLKSWRDVQEYKAVQGDTLDSIAQKFGVTSDSIKWSNSLAADTIATGTTLVIPPVNGIVVTAKAGDTPQSLAAKYQANAEQIARMNDAEQSGLVLGRRIVIPDGKIVPVVATRSAVTSGFIQTNGSTGGFVPRYGGNGYDFGWCTYYAAARAGAPGNWGNANTWAYYAARSGWSVSSAPRPGAIFQTARGWAGHVGIVEEVSEDGSQIKVSDMNGFAGFGRVGYSGWMPAGSYEHYIYH